MDGYSDQSANKRVSASIWSHGQGPGKVRYTVGIYRRYYSEREGRWVNSPLFDRKDLDDVLIFVNEAKKKLDRMTGEQSPD